MGEQAAMTASRKTEVELCTCEMCDGRGCIDMSDDDSGKVIRCPACLGYGIVLGVTNAVTRLYRHD
ncbi:MAG: hypothetical protein DMD33_19790 [Gemmatimonadetes bacterium]|nr:MAG: hypothetical protein DMD33_19790 [Gemmatimonadota bacterium]